jgi:hypothetical protein
MRRYTRAWALAFLSAAVVSAADAPYFGKWKVDASKSKVQGTASIEKLPSGEYKYDGSGFVYRFNLDGKEYPMPDGGTTSWKATNDTTWEVVNRANGKISGKFTLTLNGANAMSATTVIPQADGKDITQTSALKRLSGGPGFVGKWQTMHFDVADEWLEITPDGADGLKLAQPNSLCMAKFDGKQYPMTGATDGSKSTMSFRKTGAASFEAITYIDGKPFFKDVYKVSADGKVLTDIGTPEATKKPDTIILVRQ